MWSNMRNSNVFIEFKFKCTNSAIVLLLICLELFPANKTFQKYAFMKIGKILLTIGNDKPNVLEFQINRVNNVDKGNSVYQNMFE